MQKQLTVVLRVCWDSVGSILMRLHGQIHSCPVQARRSNVQFAWDITYRRLFRMHWKRKLPWRKAVEWVFITVPVSKKFAFWFRCVIVTQCERLCSVLRTTLEKQNKTERKIISGIEWNHFSHVDLWKAFFKLSEVFFKLFIKPFFELCCPIWS